jgi:hypothetical protein
MHDLWEPHLTAMKRILRYIQGKSDYGLLLHRSSSSDLMREYLAQLSEEARHQELPY